MSLSKRYSKKREAILQCIRSTKTHPSAEWVYGQLKANHPELSLGTVYRNISLFRKEGVVTCVGTVNGVERFDGDCHPHAHFICERCDAVIDVETNFYPDLDLKLEEDTGVTVTRHELAFRGICPNCK